MVLIILGNFFSALLYESVAVFAVRRGFRSGATRLFFLLCQLFAIWALGYTFMYATEDRDRAWFWYRIGAFGWCIAPAVGLHFYFSVSKIGEGSLWRRMLLVLFYIVGLVLLSRVLLGQLIIRDIVRVSPFYWSEVIVVPDLWLLAFMTYATGNLVIGTTAVFLWWRRTPVRREKKQARAILWAQTTAYGVIVTMNIVLPYLEIRIVPSIGVALNIFWVALLWHSIEKYRLFALTPASTSELIIKKITDGLLLLDPMLRVFQCNDRFLELLGLEERDVTGHPVSEFFSSPLPISFDRGGNGAPAEPMEIEFPGTLNSRKYGPFPVQANGSVIHDADGDLMGILLIVRDGRPVQLLEKEIADRRRMAGELIEAMQKANAATEAKSDFLAKISHEIRTPLNSILGTTQLLAETKLDQETKGYVNIMERSAEALLDLINDLLDLSRIEAGHLEIDSRPFLLMESVEEAVSLIKPRADKKGIRLEAETDERVPVCVNGDPGRVRQILLNLLGNAVKFTERGAVTLKVSVEKVRKDEILLLFVIEDTGIGIPAERQSLLFERFSQVDSGITRRYGGSGLGLAITKELVERMKGEIWFESESGRGSAFFVRLPFVEAEPVEEPHPVGPQEQLKDSADRILSKREMRLLLVEDNPDNITLFLAFVRSLPLRIDLAGNGAEALDIFRLHPYDLIFMDMQMPVMDGYTAVREIRRIEQEGNLPRTPIVAFTAHAFEEERQKSLSAGCDDHISKPLKKQRLIECILKYAV